MRGAEQGPGGEPPKKLQKLRDLEIPPGVAINGLAAIGAIYLLTREVKRRKRKKAQPTNPQQKNQ